MFPNSIPDLLSAQLTIALKHNNLGSDQYHIIYYYDNSIDLSHY